MARDEAMLNAVSRGDSPPTLRVYAWTPATISLGYFQSHEEFDQLDGPAAELAVVRRTTGGGAILHDQEITYSLALPLAHAWLARGPNALYELVHCAIINAVGNAARLVGCDGNGGLSCDAAGQRGPFFCFARRHALDVILPDAAHETGWSKLAGSAQRRKTRAVLQHGSLILSSRFSQHPCATWDSVGGPTDWSAAAARFVVAIRDEAKCTFDSGDWSSSELRDAAALQAKYARPDWPQLAR